MLVELDLFPGRRMETKADLYRSLVSRLGQLGIHKTDILVIIQEIPLDNWGIRGGIPASQTQLGYKLDV